jgi:hypothetical protein
MRSAQTLLVVAVLTIALPSIFGQDGKNQIPFTITISTPSQTVRSGMEVRIHAVLTNVSNHTIVTEREPASDQGEAHYDIRIQDKYGSTVPLTERGRAIKAHRFDGSKIKIWLQPDGKMEEETILNNQFDLTNPGEYEVQLTRPVSDDPKDGIVKSNKIMITVTP